MITRVAGVDSGRPYFELNGTRVPGYMFWKNDLEKSANDLEGLEAAGLSLFTSDFKVSNDADDDEARTQRDARMRRILSRMPSARVMPRLALSPVTRWRESNPGEMALHLDQKVGMKFDRDPHWLRRPGCRKWSRPCGGASVISRNNGRGRSSDTTWRPEIAGSGPGHGNRF